MVAGGEKRVDCCELEYVRLEAPLPAATCVDGGGVSDDGMTVTAGRSSTASVLNDWPASMGDPGTSVDGSVVCDSEWMPTSWGVVGSRPPATRSSAAPLTRGASTSESEAIVCRSMKHGIRDLCVFEGKSGFERVDVTYGREPALSGYLLVESSAAHRLKEEKQRDVDPNRHDSALKSPSKCLSKTRDTPKHAS